MKDWLDDGGTVAACFYSLLPGMEGRKVEMGLIELMRHVLNVIPLIMIHL